jgi:hypothetical protein
VKKGCVLENTISHALWGWPWAKTQMACAITTVQIHSLGKSWRIKMEQWVCKGGQWGGVVKTPKLALSWGGIYHPRKSGEMKRAGNLLRAKMLYYLPTKWRHGVLPYFPEEGPPVLSRVKGPLGHSAEMREGEKAWQ